MKRMILAPLILIAAACGSSSSGPGEKMTEKDFDTKIATAIAFDPSLLKVGDRVIYFVKRTGENTTQKYQWSAVGEDGGAIWIENKVPFDPRPMIVKTKLERIGGKVLEQWIGEPGGVPGKTYPTSRPEEGPRPIRDASSAKADSKEELDRIVISGKSYDCTRVTTNLVYPDGRKSKMVNWFSKEVPFPASKALGGLIKRQFGSLSMELAVGDHSGQSEMLIQLPQK